MLKDFLDGDFSLKGPDDMPFCHDFAIFSWKDTSKCWLTSADQGLYYRSDCQKWVFFSIQGNDEALNNRGQVVVLNWQEAMIIKTYYNDHQVWKENKELDLKNL